MIDISNLEIALMTKFNLGAPLEKINQLQQSNQDQEIDDLEREGGPVDFHGVPPRYLTRYSSSGLRNRMISTITST